MKGLARAILLGLSILIIPVAFAAPPIHFGAQDAQENDSLPSIPPREDRHRHREQQRNFEEKHPHREWQIGASLPERFRYAENYVDYTSNPKLTAPTRYQQWIKFRRHYILFNVLTNTIIKVVPE